MQAEVKIDTNSYEIVGYHVELNEDTHIEFNLDGRPDKLVVFKERGVEAPFDTPHFEPVEHKLKRWMKKLYLSKSMREQLERNYDEYEQSVYYGFETNLKPVTISINNK